MQSASGGVEGVAKFGPEDLAQGGAWHQGDIGLGNQVFGQCQIILYLGQSLDEALHIGKAVEGAIAWQTFDTRDFIERLDHEVMAFLEGLHHLIDTALVALQSGLGSDLRDGGGIGGALRLDLFHGADKLRGAAGNQRSDDRVSVRIIALDQFLQSGLFDIAE